MPLTVPVPCQVLRGGRHLFHQRARIHRTKGEGEAVGGGRFLRQKVSGVRPQLQPDSPTPSQAQSYQQSGGQRRRPVQSALWRIGTTDHDQENTIPQKVRFKMIIIFEHLLGQRK